jgi:hypothetical protein
MGGNDASLRLPSHAEKAVMGRLLGLEVLSPQISWLESEGYRDAAARLRERLFWSTNEALDQLDECDSLNDFLLRLVKDLEAEAANLPGDARRAAIIVVQEFGDLVANFVAAPYDPLSRLINAVARTAMDYYQAYGTAVPPTVWHCTIPVTTFLGGKTGLSFLSDIHLQARTEFVIGETPSARVYIKLCPRWLDAETIAALPRALLHEYIAHVPQGPYLGTRTHPDADDAFAEGWMDYIAHNVHQSALERYGPSEVLADCLILPWTSLYDATAERFFRARRELRDCDPTAAARCEGAAAARQLHDLLRRLPETRGSADDYLYRLSFGINASSLGSLARRRFAAEVRRCLLRASRSDILVTALREWLTGGIRLEDLPARLSV